MFFHNFDRDPNSRRENYNIGHFLFNGIDMALERFGTSNEAEKRRIFKKMTNIFKNYQMFFVVLTLFFAALVMVMYMIKTLLVAKFDNALFGSEVYTIDFVPFVITAFVSLIVQLVLMIHPSSKGLSYKTISFAGFLFAGFLNGLYVLDVCVRQFQFILEYHYYWYFVFGFLSILAYINVIVAYKRNMKLWKQFLSL